MNQTLITDIQRYSIHDGVGIRTTVFFKGCPLTCSWCHNPETQKFTKQLLFQEERCTGCGSCVTVCPKQAISIVGNVAVTEKEACNHCGNCLDYCLQNIRELSGKSYTVNALIREIEKDKVFYEQSGGGVTLSGGEVLAQDIDYLEELMSQLHCKGYRINIDTCGHTTFDKIERILPYVDAFLYDIKVMDGELHKQFTGVDNKLILENLSKLSQKNASIWIRIPIIGGVNNTGADMKEIARFLKDEKIIAKQINLLPYHNTGSGKYHRMQLEYRGVDFKTPEDTELKDYVTIFQQYGFGNIKIGG